METRRELYQGFGNTLSRAMELVAAPFLFAALGFLADRVLGTSPVLAIIFGVIGLQNASGRTGAALGLIGGVLLLFWTIVRLSIGGGVI